MLVLTEVSSMNTSRSGIACAAGRRCVIQSARARATSGRRCSSATSDFFVCETETSQGAGQRSLVGVHALRLGQGTLQFTQGDVGVLPNHFQKEVLAGPELPPTRRAPALRGPNRRTRADPLGQTRTGSRRDHQAPCRLPARQAILDATLKPAANVERKRCRHGVILLNRMNHKQTHRGIPRFNVTAGGSSP